MTTTRNNYIFQSGKHVITGGVIAYESFALNGVVSSSEKYVTGTGTSFLTEIADADINGNPRTTDYGYLYDGNTQLIKIAGVIDDEHLTLNLEPNPVLNSATCVVIKSPGFKQISFIGGTGGGHINGVLLPEDAEITFYQDYNGQMLEPMIAENVYYAIRW